MKLFFYYTRNIIGLMLVLGPLCGLLLNVLTETVPIPARQINSLSTVPAGADTAGIPISSGFFILLLFLISLLAGLLFAPVFYDFLPFRAWISISCLFSI